MPDDHIPITFTFEEKQHTGHFNVLKGNHYHLMVDNFYKGQLLFSDTFGWQYFGTEFNGMDEYFGALVEAWYQ